MSICVSSRVLAARSLEPLDWVCIGSSSNSPVYFGFGRTLDREVVEEVMIYSVRAAGREKVNVHRGNLETPERVHGEVKTATVTMITNDR